MSKFLKIGARSSLPGLCSPEFIEDAVTHWSFETDFPCFQILCHQEEFVTPHDQEVKKSPVTIPVVFLYTT